MNMTRLVSKQMCNLRVVLVALLGWTSGVAEAAVRRTGEAMVADQIGAANVRLTVGAVHHGQSELMPLFEGASVGETARITTGPDSHLLMVLDPGGLLALGSNTDITISRLRRVSQGLPGSLSDVKGQVEIKLHTGQVKLTGLNGGHESARVVVDERVVQAGGQAAFVVASDAAGSLAVASINGGLSIVDLDGNTLEALSEGETRDFAVNRTSGTIGARLGMQRNFMMWNNTSSRLRSALTGPSGTSIRTAGLAAGVTPRFLGPVRALLDVSPTDLDQNFRPNPQQPTVVDSSPQETFLPGPGLPASEPGVRRSNDEVLSWYNNVGVIKGVNYTPPNVSDAAEMWSAENFVPDQIQQDLRLAKDTGYTDVRVQLSIQEWLNDPEGFLDRFSQFAQMTSDADLRFVPVLLDPVELARSGYTPDDITMFVTTVLNNFKDSKNILYWDLLEAYGASGLDQGTYDTLREAVEAARGVSVNQPVTVASLTGPDGRDLMLDDADGSDLITFSSFDSAEVIEAKIKKLKELGRPVICTDWLDRNNDNTFEKLLPLFSANQVGWFNRGLVRPGENTRDGSVWQDHLFDQNGNPYDAREIELIRGFMFEKEME